MSAYLRGRALSRKKSPRTTRISGRGDGRNWKKKTSARPRVRLLDLGVGGPVRDARLGAQARLTYVSSRWEERYRRRSVCEFSRTRKMMSVLCEDAAAAGGAGGGAGRAELFVRETGRIFFFLLLKYVRLIRVFHNHT